MLGEPHNPLSRCDELVAAVLARCVLGSVVTPQGCVLRGLLPSEQFESGQMVLQVSQPVVRPAGR